MSKLPRGIIIRKSTVEDCEQILELIKELATYEKLSCQVKLTVDQLREDGFGKNPYYECLVVEKTSLPSTGGDEVKLTQLIGYALFFKKYSTFEGRSLYLEDLYVSRDFRKQGIGMELFKQVATVAVAQGCVRLDFAVLSWNQSAIEFYKKLGAIDLTEIEQWHCFRILEEPLKKLAVD